MKIIISLVFFIITGILSFANAAGNNLEESCIKIGGSKAYADLMSSEKKTQTCLEAMILELQTEFVRSEGLADSPIALLCKKVEDDSIKNCIQGLVDSLKNCNDKDSQEGIDILFKMAISLTKFSCENTELLKKAMKSNDRRCAAAKLSTLQNCTEGLINQRPSPMRPQMAGAGVNISDAISSVKLSFNSQECNQIQIAEQCAVKVLKQCEDKVFSELLDKMFKYINNDIPKCKDLPRSTRSSDAPPTSVVNVMILFISVITMSF